MEGMVEVAGVTFLVTRGEVVAFERQGGEIGRTTVADAIETSEQLWHMCEYAGILDSQQENSG